MLKTLNQLSRLNQISLVSALAPLTLGVALLATAVLPAEAIPVIQGDIYIRVGQPQPVYPGIYGNPIPNTIIYGNPVPNTIIYGNPVPSSLIYGSPIPSPVPLNSGTALYNNFPSAGYYNVNPVVGFPVPGRVILINPAIVNPLGYPNNSIYPSQGIYGYPRRGRAIIRH